MREFEKVHAKYPEFDKVHAKYSEFTKFAWDYGNGKFNAKDVEFATQTPGKANVTTSKSTILFMLNISKTISHAVLQ